MNVEAYPLYWPSGWKRTPPSKQWENRRFRRALIPNVRAIEKEIWRLGGDRLIISTNIPLTRLGLPCANVRQPEDRGVAVYFRYKAKNMCFACDSYHLVEENLRAIGKTIEALRGIERWGASDMMERAFRGFAALSAAPDWRITLELGPDATLADIEAAFKRLAKLHHPDMEGGDHTRFVEINAAHDAAIRDFAY